jgi:UDP-2,3-diacylglucosamine pyrophosphatase LpxH
MSAVPEFDELYVISDLHLGGVKGFQIFGSANELVAFIDWVRDRPAVRVALVINGDTVDFLAEPGSRYFDPHGANDKLDRIVRDDSFKLVFDALKQFVSRVNRHLIFTLGNHDIELALPHVRAHLLDLISGGDDASKGRITLALDGTGYACSVAGSSVLCVHGNEVDTWNVTDYERLRRSGRDYVQGRPMEDWTPNAGTKLVIDVMNIVKRDYPFVDLLKPEVEAVVPVLLAMDPKQIQKLARLMAVGTRLGWDSVRRMTGFLSAGEEAEPGSVAIDRKAEDEAVSTAPLDRLLANTFSRGAGRSSVGPESRDLMKDIEDRFERQIDPLELVTPGQQGEKLGGFGASWDWITRKPTYVVLREALEKLKKDLSFDIRNPDSPYRRIDELMGSGFDYVITGHTHQERSLARSRGRGAYFNSGTWVALMHFTDKQLSSDSEFKGVYETLKNARTIADLERLPGLVERKPAVVSITQENGAVRAQLQRVSLAKGAIRLKDVGAGAGGN